MTIGCRQYLWTTPLKWLHILLRHLSSTTHLPTIWVSEEDIISCTCIAKKFNCDGLTFCSTTIWCRQHLHGLLYWMHILLRHLWSITYIRETSYLNNIISRGQVIQLCWVWYLFKETLYNICLRYFQSSCSSTFCWSKGATGYRNQSNIIQLSETRKVASYTGTIAELLQILDSNEVIIMELMSCWSKKMSWHHNSITVWQHCLYLWAPLPNGILQPV